MLKKRLIPVLFIKNGLIVRSQNFHSHKIIGNVVNEVRRYNDWNVDELIYIDISRDGGYDSRRNDHKVGNVESIYDILEMVSKECFMPLTFGGGVRTYEQIREYLHRGADKVVLNTMLHRNPDEVRRAIKSFGSQAIVACIDYRGSFSSPSFFADYGNAQLEFASFSEIIQFVEELGCGEILINSMDRDGSGEGYDLEVLNSVVRITKLPFIACGGAASILDFEDLAEINNIDGIAAGNMFHFTENIYPRAKMKLNKNYKYFRE